MSALVEDWNLNYLKRGLSFLSNISIKHVRNVTVYVLVHNYEDNIGHYLPHGIAVCYTVMVCKFEGDLINLIPMTTAIS